MGAAVAAAVVTAPVNVGELAAHPLGLAAGHFLLAGMAALRVVTQSSLLLAGIENVNPFQYVVVTLQGSQYKNSANKESSGGDWAVQELIAAAGCARSAYARAVDWYAPPVASQHNQTTIPYLHQRTKLPAAMALSNYGPAQLWGCQESGRPPPASISWECPGPVTASQECIGVVANVGRPGLRNALYKMTVTIWGVGQQQ